MNKKLASPLDHDSSGVLAHISGIEDKLKVSPIRDQLLIRKSIELIPGIPPSSNLSPAETMNEVETFYGPIEGTADALRVFELCRQGRLGRVRRRLHEKERRLIRSGSVFVFDEQESGIRRWTDGRLWSPSRILGNFLIYRELERRLATDGGLDQMRQLRPLEPRSIHSSSQATPSEADLENLGTTLPWLTTPVVGEDSDSPTDSFIDPNKIIDYEGAGYGIRVNSVSEGCASSFIGPNSFRLLNSKKLQASSGVQSGHTRYIFKPDGLIKKTISAKVDGRMQHLVCYFSESDFILAHSPNSRKPRPTSVLLEELRKTRIPADLVLQQNFRKQPSVEYGFPVYDRQNTTRRRHSMHLPTTRPPTICPRLSPNDIHALDLASNWSQLSSHIDPLLMPENSDPDQLGEQGNIAGDLATQPLPSTNAIMEECIKMVLGSSNDNISLLQNSGLTIGSEDPPLPIIERPNSTVGL